MSEERDKVEAARKAVTEFKEQRSVLTIEEVALEVKEWSLSNFGDQKGINHIAPALGLVEELGELEEAIIAENHTLVEDSIGDIGIYTLDLCARLDISVTDVWPTQFGMYNHRAVTLGKVAHCILKHHQGIRGFKDKEFFRQQFIISMKDFLGGLQRHWDITYLTIKTWEQVKERNWKKNATTGGQ